MDDNAREYIEFAVGGANRMHLLINDLLAYSRINTRGREFSWISMEKILDEVTQNLELTIRENAAVITRDPLPNIYADVLQMEQLLQNLLSNAIKYRSEIPPAVHVSCRRNENEWIFSVKDNGIGIDPRYFERIFVIFQRLHTNETYPGTGIGLALSKKIIERHAGRIWLESGEGMGTTFYFTIPHPPAGR